MGKSSSNTSKASGKTAAGSVIGEAHGNSCGTLIRKTHNLHYLLAALVSAITFLLYLPSLQHRFLNWDDPLYVSENPYICSFDLGFLKWAFSSFRASNWHPLTWISHAIDYAFWGLNPLGHHLTNIILHAANTFVVVLVAIGLAGFRKDKTINTSSALFSDKRALLIMGGVTGLLFGLHPAHVESVAWVAERKDLLCALFFLLSIIQYAKYATVKDIGAVLSISGFFSKYYLMALGLFVLALLSKPMAISLPVVLLILDWFPLRRIASMKSFLLAFMEKLPFICLSLISAMLAVMAHRGAVVPLKNIPLSSRMLVAAKSLLFYLWKIILPVNLIPYYPYPLDVSLFSLEYIFSVTFVVIITAACVVLLKKHAFLLPAWSYYLVTLIPVLGIVQVGGQAMADRYLYLPSIGPFLIVGLLAAWVFRLADSLSKRRLIALRAGAVTAILWFIVLSFLTFQQIGVWKSDIDLWSYVIEKDPERVPLAYENRGVALEGEGRLKEAVADYGKAIALSPENAQWFVNRGLVLLRLGQFDPAIADFKRACELGDSFGCNAPQYLLRRGP